VPVGCGAVCKPQLPACRAVSADREFLSLWVNTAALDFCWIVVRVLISGQLWVEAQQLVVLQWHSGTT